MELAYLDPGSGSIIVTALVGGVASVGVAFRAFGHRVTGIFRGKSTRSEDESPEVAAAEDGDESSADVTTDGEDSEQQVKVDS